MNLVTRDYSLVTRFFATFILKGMDDTTKNDKPTVACCYGAFLVVYDTKNEATMARYGETPSAVRGLTTKAN